MNARPAAPNAFPRYLSGHCGISRCEACRGHYAGTPCGCACHHPAPRCAHCGQPIPQGAPDG